jgi:hypothetical protein
MKLTVFQSMDGDCMLVTGADGKMVLADGGRRRSYSASVAAALAKLKPKEKDFEAVYISHIDADHVEGIEQMLGDLIEWGRFDFQKGQPGGADAIPPEVPRPIRPKKFWHNSFHDQVDKNAGEIVDVMAASAAMLSALPASAPASLSRVAIEHANLATSMRQALNISSRIRKGLLNIKLNPEFEGKLMLIKNAGPKFIKVGDMKWHVIGPGESQLKRLRHDWDKWLKTEDGAKAVEAVKEKAARDERSIGNSTAEIPTLIAQKSSAASLLAETFLKNEFALAAKVEGRDGITVPNLASLMFLVEEGTAAKRKTMLMTGDGHWRDIVDGLEKQKLFDANGNLHVNVLKIQHHGADGNMKPEFLERVTADNYVFCGISEEHSNPEKLVVEQVLDSRLVAAKKGSHAKVNNKFKLWFSGSPKNSDLAAGDRKHIKMIQAVVTARANPSRFSAVFHESGPSFDIKL